MSFEVLKELRNILKLVELYPGNVMFRDIQIASRWVFRPLFISTVVYILTSFWYCADLNWDLNKITGSLCFLSGTMQIAVIYFDIFKSRDIVIDSADSLQRLVQARCEKSIRAYEIYRRIELKNTKLISYLYVAQCVTTLAYNLVPGLLPIAFLIFGFPKPELWIMPLPTKSFFDIQHFAGFYATWVLSVVQTISYFLLYALNSVFQIGFCTYTNACVDDFKAIMKSVEEHINKKCNENDFKQTDPFIRECFIDAVGLHVEILRIMNNVRGVLQGPLFYQLIAFVTFIAISLLFLDQSINHIDFDMVFAVTFFNAQCLLNLIACYFADRLEEDFLDVGEVTYNILWYQIASKEREFIPWIIFRAQKPVKLTGFKIIQCSMATFMKLFRSAGSYYILIRQMTH